MSKIQIWLKAFRLRTLPLSLSGIILGSGIANQAGYWDNSIFIWSLITTVLFQILSNLANDLGDHQKGADNENRVGPARSTQTGEISASQMKKAVIILTIMSFLSAGILIYSAALYLTEEMIWFYSGLGLASVAAAIMYTMGKKAYGYNGMGDIMVFVFFGLVSVLGVYGLYAQELNSWNILAAVGIGSLSAAVLNLNNLRDNVNDKAVGKNTLVVKMGFENGKLYQTTLVFYRYDFIWNFLFDFQQLGLSSCFLSAYH